MFAALSQTVVDVQLIADVPAMAGMTFHTTQLHGMTVIGLRESPHHGLNVVVKRAMDIVLSSIAIVLLAPLMAADRRCSSSSRAPGRCSTGRSGAG